MLQRSATTIQAQLTLQSIYSLFPSIVISNKVLMNPGCTDPYEHHRLAPLGNTTTAFGQEVETVAAAAE